MSKPKQRVNVCRKIRKSVMQETLEYLRQVKDEILKQKQIA